MKSSRRTDAVHVTLPSPIGPLTLVADGGQLTGLYMDAQRHRPADHSFGPAGDPAQGSPSRRLRRSSPLTSPAT